MGERALIIAPHADDAEFGCGGYLARMLERDTFHATIMVVCNSTYKSRHTGELVSAEIREIEQKEAIRVFGEDRVALVMLNHGMENELHRCCLGQLVAGIEDVISVYRPTRLFIPLPSFNIDHTVVHDACITALRPAMGQYFVPHVYAYEYPMQFWGPLVPYNGKAYLWLEQRHLKVKMEALNKHESQMSGKAYHLTGPQGVRDLASRRGAECGVEFAEMYYSIRDAWK
jgi:LmbE family N-acetylglucosaminyl deacetylase